MLDFDIVIIGGGLVGLATACALSDSSLNIALVEPQSMPQSPLPDHPTLRASAINAASQRYFKQLVIWDTLLNSDRVLSFNSINVWEKNSFAKFTAQAKDYHHDNLGYIIENQLMHTALWKRIKLLRNITVFSTTPQNITVDEGGVGVTLANHQTLYAKLIIGADGAHSWVREQQNISVVKKNYRHHALITTVETELPHQACASQIFYPEGVIAFLPLWQPHLSCLVWSAPPQKAEQLKAMNKKAFENELSAMTHYVLGPCKVINPRHTYPLTARYTRHFVQHRVALIGDAAHTIHPLAGQGVNLGFQDSKQLVDTILHHHQMGSDFGLLNQLRTFERQRQRQAIMMLAAMQGIQDIFAGTSLPKKIFRGVGMNLINHFPAVKKQLIRQALGI